MRSNTMSSEEVIVFDPHNRGYHVIRRVARREAQHPEPTENSFERLHKGDEGKAERAANEQTTISLPDTGLGSGSSGLQSLVKDDSTISSPAKSESVNQSATKDASLKQLTSTDYGPSSLCQDCLRIDFSRIEKLWQSDIPDSFQWNINENVVNIARVGRKYRDNIPTDCPLCQAIREHCRVIHYWHDRGLDSLCAALLVPRGRSDTFVTNARAHSLAVLFLVPDDLPEISSWPDIPRILKDNGYLVCQRRSSDEQLPRTRSLVQPHINIDTIKAWLNHCQASHEECSKPNPPQFSLTLIDCQRRQLVDSELTASYVALSYVWGNVQHNPLEDDRLPRDVPAVIRDAMDVTQSLGYHYLWVDAYCINQDNTKLKHIQIQNMHHIYRCAEVTLIDAVGSDSAFGLAGSAATPRIPPRQINISTQGYEISSCMKNGAHLETSPWNQRAWTYQEALLSRRVILFDHDQFHLECSLHHGSESLGSCHWAEEGSALFVEHNNLHNGPGERQREQSQSLDFEDQYFNYCARVLDYTGRSLTLDKDSLNGFAAIIALFKGLLPEPKPRNAVLSILTGIPFLSSGDSKHSSIDPGSSLLLGLMWYHRNIARRRYDLPSWSWAGWKGKVYFSHFGPRISWHHELLIRDVLVEERCYEADGTMIVVRAPVFKAQHLLNPEVLIFGAIALPPSAITLKKEDGYLDWYIYQAATQAFISREILSSEDMLGHIVGGEYKVLLMGLVWEGEELPISMELSCLIVKKTVEDYERIGTLKAYSHEPMLKPENIKTRFGKFWEAVRELRRTGKMENWVLR